MVNYKQGDHVEYRPIGGTAENVSHSTGEITKTFDAEDGTTRYTIKNDNTGKETNYQVDPHYHSHSSCNLAMMTIQEMNIVKKV
ncbi:hypothetical protein C8Q75DRAFT_810502 [Abortiporus biennis]|nr:hypothetical protein C8Q75DRAFT_810502 [Abortiporus biennis]